MAGPVLIVGDLVELTVACRTTDQIGLNILHYYIDRTELVPVDQLTTITDKLVVAGLPAAYKAAISNSASYEGMRVRVLHPTLSIPISDVTGAGIGGTAGDLLPRQVSGLITKRSAVAGRRKSGRVYIPFPSANDNGVTSVPKPAYIAALDAIKVILSNAIITAGLFRAYPVIYQRPTNLNPWGSRYIAQWVTAPRWATQRRRGSFGRPNPPPI